jgi:hypothetical protein
MTEEERLAYIAKHPIRKTEKPRGVNFSTETIDYRQLTERKKATRKGQSRKSS